MLHTSPILNFQTAILFQQFLKIFGKTKNNSETFYQSSTPTQKNQFIYIFLVHNKDFF